ncbi:MAG TPA: FtsX-like permease family protein, partial [Nitrospirae bacterium]|nr:FtsX-like permease family protein [Nitrospirota bacterium]
EDNSLLSKTCVLGQTVVRELFDNQNPIGETVRIKNINFKVIGILKERGASPMGTDMDNRILVPLSTAKRRLFNINYINTIRIHVESPSMLEAVTKEVENVLRERHHIIPPAEDDFMIKNAASISKMVKDVAGTLTTFLGLLSLISLAVGGIVIANIMFVSVNERKKEIGIRRAFGATVKDIMKQFLGEALIVTISGGIIGTIIGIIVSIGLSMVKKIPVVVSWQPFALAIVFSGIVGIAAGIKPARRAAALNPVDAIRG